MSAAEVELPPAADLALEVLAKLEPGRRVADAQHDLWTKQPDGKWLYSPEGLTLSVEHLLHVWGPVSVIPKEGI